MSTLTIRLPASKHHRLKDFARARGVSLNKLVEEWVITDSRETFRFRAAISRVGEFNVVRGDDQRTLR